jgi:hypothetical protein
MVGFPCAFVKQIPMAGAVTGGDGSRPSIVPIGRLRRREARREETVDGRFS